MATQANVWDGLRKAWKRQGGRMGFARQPQIECVDCGMKRPISQTHCPMCQFAANPNDYGKTMDEIMNAPVVKEHEPMEIVLVRVFVGFLAIGTVGLLMGLAQEIMAGHWWVVFLCLGVLCGVSYMMMKLIVVLIQWKASQKS